MSTTFSTSDEHKAAVLPQQLEVVSRVQSRLRQLVVMRAVLVSAAAGLTVWLLMTLVLRLMLPNGMWLSVVLALASAIGAAIVVLQRAGPVTRARAALWLEEQFPALQFALVTLSEFAGDKSRTLSTDAHARLVSAVGAPAIAQPLARSARTQLLVPAACALLLAAGAVPLHARLVDVQPANANNRARFGSSATKKQDALNKNAMANWKVRVVPPAYSALGARALGDVGLVNALVGSVVEISGIDVTAPDAVTRALSDTLKPSDLRVVRSNDGWHAQFVVSASPVEVRFSLGTAARQLLVEPRADSLPVVQLKLPLRDSVYRAPKGVVTLSADAHDDLGLATANFELIVTSGEGEKFTAKAIAIAAQKLNGEHDKGWQATILLDTMKLEQGDIVHMRAVARDRHPDAARELGASETRTFRIARASEYDSVAVEPAPPPEVQKSLMSQRMLLIMTEKLEAQRPALQRAALVSESRKLSAEQQRLRKTVGDIVFQRLDGEDGAGHEHSVTEEQGKLVATAGAVTGGPPTTEDEGDESPIIGVNKPLLEAYNAMWDAGSALDIADTKAAIPHMKLALAAIERARTAERIYLRGKPPVVVIDVAKVRLAGRDTGVVNTRSAREALSPKEAQREARLLAAALLLTRDVNAARDSLAVLRLESLTSAPRLAAALGDALEIVRRGGNVTDALVRARRLLGNGAPADSLSRWRGL